MEIPDSGRVARCLATLVFMSLAACDRTPRDDQVVEAPQGLHEVRGRILDAVESGDAPSLAIAVAREGQIIWMEAFGFADKSSARAAGPNTVFAIGSTSKSMTATLAMALVERGLFDLDTGIDRYLDEIDLEFLSVDGDFPTTRQLLTMTGGVPHGGGVTGRPEYTLPREQISRRTELVAYPPGALYEYSNYSIGLAMRVMESATGRPYDELMREYLFEPLQMSDTFVSYRPGLQSQASLYDADGEPIGYYRFYPEAAGGFYSSVADLMRFAQFHAGHRKPNETVISVENLSRMHAAQPPEVPGALAAFGFGSVEMPTAGITQLISNGNVRGGNSHVSILMPGGDIIIAAMNQTSRSSLADSIALDIAEMLRPGLKEDFGRLVERRRHSAQQSFPGNPEWTGRWRGALEGPGYSAVVEVRITDDGTIRMKLGDAGWQAVDNVRFPYGSIIGRVERLIGTDSQTVRLLLRDGILYGHTVARIIDGDTHGSYIYRMRLVNSTD